MTIMMPLDAVGLILNVMGALALLYHWEKEEPGTEVADHHVYFEALAWHRAGYGLLVVGFSLQFVSSVL